MTETCFSDRGNLVDFVVNAQPTKGGLYEAFRTHSHSVLSSVASLAETDDRGVYRIYGLPAGRYTVSVGGPGEGARLRTAGGGRAYSRTFHPDVTDEARAKVIEVAAGTEAADKVRSLQVIAGRGGCKPRIRISSCLQYAKIPQQRFLRMRH